MISVIGNYTKYYTLIQKEFLSLEKIIFNIIN